MLRRHLSQLRIDRHENGNVEEKERNTASADSEISSSSSNNRNKRKNSENDDDIIITTDITNGDDESIQIVANERTNESSSISSQNRSKIPRRSDTYGECHPYFQFHISKY